MRVPSYHDHDEARNDGSMTPMIDVVFLLLIFFVCASVGQIREALLPTELAAGSLEPSEVIEQPKPLLGEVWVRLRTADDGQTVFVVNDLERGDFDGLRRLLADLAEAAPEIPVILDIAPAVPMGDLIRVYDTCKAAGFQSIDFAVDPPQAKGANPRKPSLPKAP